MDNYTRVVIDNWYEKPVNISTIVFSIMFVGISVVSLVITCINMMYRTHISCEDILIFLALIVVIVISNIALFSYMIKENRLKYDEIINRLKNVYINKRSDEIRLLYEFINEHETTVSELILDIPSGYEVMKHENNHKYSILPHDDIIRNKRHSEIFSDYVLNIGDYGHIDYHIVRSYDRLIRYKLNELYKEKVLG